MTELNCRLATEADLAALCQFYQDICAHQKDDQFWADCHWGIYPSEKDIAEAIAQKRAVVGIKDGKIACIHTIENATFFAEDPALIEVLKSLGVLMSSLSWNAQGPLASGHDTHAGLTAAGIEALTQMEHAGMVLDVSHLNDECFDEVAARATRPFVASHSNSRAVCGAKRNLTDDQFRTIRDMGGIVGLNYCSEFLSNDATDKTAADVTFDQLAAHIEHWLDLGGEDVIALGGDWDGATVPAFLSDASKMPEFQNMLSKHFGKTVMQKLCSDNALAFFERY